MNQTVGQKKDNYDDVCQKNQILGRKICNKTTEPHQYESDLGSKLW